MPRVLHAAGVLGAMLTDAWIPTDSVLGKLPVPALRRLRGRYHSDLSSANVLHFTRSSFGFEIRARVSKSNSGRAWPHTLARNRWFQRRGVAALKRLAPLLEKAGKQLTLFAYSYAALDLLRVAKQRGWKAILGQIDGGRGDEKIVEAECRRHPELNSLWQAAPPEYWRAWKDECALADAIIVNSDWSNRLLLEEGIEPEKLHIIPVAYEAGVENHIAQRTYPQEFSVTRPLRILFLGAFVLRKGAAAVLETIRLLQNEPVEFWIVGSVGVDVPAALRESPKVKWIGPVSREATSAYYRDADLFLFPTISDGFGMTQVEARGWKLPVITTPYCAPIIQDGVNGLVISELDGEILANAVCSLLHDPRRLDRLATGVEGEREPYSQARVRERILALSALDEVCKFNFLLRKAR